MDQEGSVCLAVIQVGAHFLRIILRLVGKLIHHTLEFKYRMGMSLVLFLLPEPKHEELECDSP
jgi:hypothetical protein